MKRARSLWSGVVHHPRPRPSHVTPSFAHPALPLPHSLSSHPVSSPPSRTFSSLRSGFGTSRLINPRSGREAFDDEPEGVSASRDVARRLREKDEARLEERARRQLSFNAYNRELIERVRAAEDWVSLLRLLSTELSSTSYNMATSKRWLNPNKKHTQLTVSSAQWMVLRLIKLRGTRRRALQDDRLMEALHDLVVVVETMAPKLHNEAGMWRRMYHPYLYLRRQVELWREGKEEEWKKRQRAEEERRLQMDSKAKGVVTDTELRTRLSQAAKLRGKASPTSASSSPADEEQSTVSSGHPFLSWADRMRRGGEDEEEEEEYARLSPDEKMRKQLAYLLEREQRGKDEYLQARGEEKERRREGGRPRSGSKDEVKVAGTDSDAPRATRRTAVRSFFT